jgi:hypothetical protein
MRHTVNSGKQCGENNPFSKLKNDDVRNIRELIAIRDEAKRTASSLTNCEIGKKFGVSAQTIRFIANRTTWFSV